MVEWDEQIDSAIEYVDKDNYQALDKHVKDKRIVLLGENSHFIGDYYTSKINIIKHLHKHHGFNVVIFESGLLEVSLINESIKKEEVRNRIKESMLGIYHNEEIMPLFTDPDLAKIQKAGMDVQSTIKTASNKVVQWIKNIDNEVGSLLGNAENFFFEIDDVLKKEPLRVTKETKLKMKKALNAYTPILRLLEGIDKSEFKHPDCKKLEVIKRGILNRQQWIKVNLRGRFTSGSMRDIYMFENIQWLMEFYTDEKVIIWSHNFHIRKKRSLPLRLLRIQTVGHLLSQHYPEETYTIGLYATNGTCLTSLRNEFEISIQNKYHLELVISKKDNYPILLCLQTKRKVKKIIGQNNVGGY